MNEKKLTSEELKKIEKRRQRKKSLPVLLMAGPVSLWMVVFVMIPLIYVIVLCFCQRSAYGTVVYSFSLDNFKNMCSTLYAGIYKDSFVIAVLNTVICLLVGYPVAYRIAKMPSKRQAQMIMLLMIPFWTSSLLRLYSWNLTFQPNSFLNNFLMNIGLIDEPLNLLYSQTIVMLGMVTGSLPFAVLPMYSSIEKLDKNMLEASADLGANPVVTFFKVTLPQTFPGIFSAILLTFIPSLGTYTVPEVLGGGKVMLLGSLIRNQFLTSKNWPFGAALSLVMIVGTLLMLFIYSRFADMDDLEVF